MVHDWFEKHRLEACSWTTRDVVRLHIAGGLIVALVGVAVVACLWRTLTQRAIVTQQAMVAGAVVVMVLIQSTANCHEIYFSLFVTFCCIRTVLFVLENAIVPSHAYEDYRKNPREALRTAIGRVATPAFLRYTTLSAIEFFFVSAGAARLSHLVHRHEFFACAPQVWTTVGLGVLNACVFAGFLSDAHARYVMEDTTPLENAKVAAFAIVAATLFVSCGRLPQDDVHSSTRVVLGAAAVALALALVPIQSSEVSAASKRVVAGKAISFALFVVGVGVVACTARANRAPVAVVGAASAATVGALLWQA